MVTVIMIESGTAEVWHTSVDTDEPELVHVAGKGDSFGEEGVITGINSSTVIMRSSGTLLRLGTSDFNDLLAYNPIDEVNYADAEFMVEKGAALLDVRYAIEHEIFEPLSGSLHVPLHMIRKSIHQLDSGLKYVVYCKTGVRSRVAAFLLKQRGVDAVSLKNGIAGYRNKEANFG